jgi:hypothetical protein
MERTINEYLWGYDDPLLTQLQKLLPTLIHENRLSVFASVVIDLVDVFVDNILQLSTYV